MDSYKIIPIILPLFFLIGCQKAAAPIKLTDGIIEPKEAIKETVTNIETKKNKELVKTSIGPENQIKYYKVTKIIDGDTISVDIDGVVEILRLIGINTPETKDPRKPVECFGIEASNKAKELLGGQWVELEKDPSQGEWDKYGRLLRYVRTEDGLFYNLEIIKQGFAYEYTYFAPYKYQTEFKAAERYARENKLGLWAEGACAAESFAAKESPLESKASLALLSSCECSSNKYNCSDFKTQGEAQALFDCCGGADNDVHKLDSDGDSRVCESLLDS